VALVLERTILTERPPLVGEVSANFSFLKFIIFKILRSHILVSYISAQYCNPLSGYEYISENYKNCMQLTGSNPKHEAVYSYDTSMLTFQTAKWCHNPHKLNYAPWSESSRELYRTSESHLSAKLVPNFCG
jgi:hypothetical protein